MCKVIKLVALHITRHLRSGSHLGLKTLVTPALEPRELQEFITNSKLLKYVRSEL